MEHNQLLIDEAYTMETEVVEELNEGTLRRQKNYYIYGTFSTPDKKNRNGRIYSSTLWEKNVEEYQYHIKERTNNAFGELEHPTRVDVEPMKAVMRITSLKMENGVVKGRAKILNDNSPETNKIKALIDEGMKIGVSSRGTGRMKGAIVEDFKLSTYDIVKNPSDYNANLSGITESTEATVHLNESTGSYVCDENGCTLQSDPADLADTQLSESKETPCSIKAKMLIETLNEFTNPSVMTESEKLAADLIARKKYSCEQVNESLAQMADKLLSLLPNTKAQLKFEKEFGSVYKMSEEELMGHISKLEKK